jgi:hypothetical protein
VKPQELEKTAEGVAGSIAGLGAIIMALRKALSIFQVNSVQNKKESVADLTAALAKLRQEFDSFEAQMRVQLSEHTNQIALGASSMNVLDARLKGEHHENTTKADLTLSIVRQMQEDLNQIRDHLFKLARG